jgi:squamous cell carcinoma antigen recognized by T-cells 3
MPDSAETGRIALSSLATFQQERQRTIWLDSSKTSVWFRLFSYSVLLDVQCGAIREVKITQLPNILVATVEFAARDSVPAALTKDKKRVHNHEINVHLAWESTLYVTNFPENADDTSIRKLFAQVHSEIWFNQRHSADTLCSMGIFSTFGGQARSSRAREDSVMFSTRLQCVLFVSGVWLFSIDSYFTQTAARLALESHGRELEPGLSLNVYISNPERRKERTDADAREVYVAGLSKFVTKGDLEKLFRTVSSLVIWPLLPLTNVSMVPWKTYGWLWMPTTIQRALPSLSLRKRSDLSVKSLALVDCWLVFPMQRDAAKALGANNYELKKRRIAVTLSDTRVRSRKRYEPLLTMIDPG